MSEIYISGMKMPTSCASCKIKRRNGKKMVCPLCCENWDIHDPMSADYRLENCPLIPVPDHGRLIDADALMEYKSWVVDAWSQSMSMRTEAVNVMDIVNAPTIIPADKEGERCISEDMI